MGRFRQAELDSTVSSRKWCLLLYTLILHPKLSGPNEKVDRGAEFLKFILPQVSNTLSPRPLSLATAYIGASLPFDNDSVCILPSPDVI